MSELGEALAAATTEATEASLTVTFDQIPAIPARYLWPGVLPYRTPVMLAAPGGTGKGLAIAAITALVTTGRPFPGEPEGTREPGSVIIVAPEDDANEDLAFRLRASGANLALVHDLTYLPDGSPFTLPGSLDDLRDAITEIGGAGPPVRLVALDPLMALAERSLGSARAARDIVEQLQAVARDTGVAMIVSHHTVKSGAIAGNGELVNAMRLVWRVAAAKDSPGIRVMTVEKTNREAGPSVRYRIEGEGELARAVFCRPEDGASVPGSRAARLRLVAQRVSEGTLTTGEAMTLIAEEPILEETRKEVQP